MAEWRWVPGDDKDPAERWLLVEGDGPLPGPRVILTCGQVEATYQDRIAAVPDYEAVLRQVDSYFRNLEIFNGGAMGNVSRHVHEGVKAAIAKGKGGAG